MENRNNITHESFGKISFSKVSSSGGRQFYGSNLKQSHYIEMEIHSSTMERSITSEHYHQDKRLSRVRMTTAQFSELVSSINRGSGVCCTIEQIGEKIMQPLPEIDNRKKYIQNEFAERMKNFQKKLSDKQLLVNDLSKKKTLNKSDAELLKSTMSWITQEITSNLPYLSTCFEESMESVVIESKLEIENFIESKTKNLNLNNEEIILLSNEK